MKNDLKKIRLSNNSVYLYIVKWDEKDEIKGLRSVGDAMNKVVSEQLDGSDPKSGFFTSDFINKEEGIVLCVNTATYMSKFFGKRKAPPTTDEAKDDLAHQKLTSSLRFTVVYMPEEFKNRSALSSPYLYGEKLLVSASYQRPKVAVAASIGSKTLALHYIDTNAKGRGVGGGLGSGAAIWS